MSYEENPTLIYGEIIFDQFPDGNSVIGGAPFNIAWHLAGFNSTPLLMSALGNDDHAKKAIELMDNWGINSTLINRHEKIPTGRANITFKEGEPQYSIPEPAAFDDIELPNIDFAENSILYYGSLAFRQPKNKDRIEKLKSNTKLKLVLDINLRAPYWDEKTIYSLIHGAFCLKVNLEELYNLSSRANESKNTLEDIATDFKIQHQIANIIVTRGKEGAVLIDELNTTHYTDNSIMQSNIDIVDTVGAGDAFMSIILLGIKNQWSWTTILERAQQFATVMVGHQGATSQHKEIYTDLKRLWALD